MNGFSLFSRFDAREQGCRETETGSADGPRFSLFARHSLTVSALFFVLVLVLASFAVLARGLCP
jgi:hypothetical protein